MVCPICEKGKLKVIETRCIRLTQVRIRECKNCKEQFYSTETIDYDKEKKS